MKFYCAWYCPFAQRVWLALLLKRIVFEYIEVDPYQRSDWWLAVSRMTAKVPVIVVPNNISSGETTVIESARILEYLDDRIPNVHPLLPQDANERAEQRYWMDYIDKAILPYFYRFLKAKDKGEYRENSKDLMLIGLKHIAQAMAKRGPFFYGSQITIVDIMLAPFAYRIDVLLRHYREFNLPQYGKPWLRYQHWYRSALEEPAFSATSTDHQGYQQRLIDFYLPYSKGEGQKDVTVIN